MTTSRARALIAAVLVLAAGAFGYELSGGAHTSATVAAPSADTLRILYSLDQKQNDKEIIALIDGAERFVYFAMYEFTQKDIADALVAAKERGIDVQGLVDSGEASSSYDKPVMQELVDAGIPIETEKHADGTGIMHIKAIVTDKAYALGSYNWTGSATTENDELLEIGTSNDVRTIYEKLIKRLIDTYHGNSLGSVSPTKEAGTIDYTDAPKHIGEMATVRGTLIEAYPSASGTVFLDFCKNYKGCPFSAVIFASDVEKFGDLSSLAGSVITVTGKISSYQGTAEIVLSSPSQIGR